MFARGSVLRRAGARHAGAIRLGIGATVVKTAALVQASCAFARPAQAPVGPPPVELGGESVAFPSTPDATAVPEAAEQRRGG